MSSTFTQYKALGVATGLALCSVALAPILPARADYAIVVGVRNYPNLPDARELQGAESDAKDICVALEKLKFKCVPLINKEATYDAITKAFKTAAKEIKPGERFVFFFAGHGTNFKTSSGLMTAILPFDATNGGSPEKSVCISRSTLREWLLNIPSQSRTAFLDSCFSGGMRRAWFKDKKEIIQRYVEFSQGARGVPTAGGADLVDPDAPSPTVSEATTSPNKPSPVTPPDPKNTIRFFAAAQQNETAGEWIYNGVHHGMFSHALLEHLTPEAINKETAFDATTKIKNDVAEISDGFQVPLSQNLPLQDSLLGTGGLPTTGGTNNPGNGSTPSPGAVASAPLSVSVWDLFYINNTAPQIAQLRLSPNSTIVCQHREVVITCMTKEDAFIFLLEKDTQKNVQLLFPYPDSYKDRFSGEKLETTILGASEKRGDLGEQALAQGSGGFGLDDLGPSTYLLIVIPKKAIGSEDLARSYIRTFLNVPPDGSRKARVPVSGDFRVLTSQFTLNVVTEEEAKKHMGEAKP